ncbi:hypothetical protein LOK74_19090 [Brevibacillus humidisoli]|uniref:hypothetical protein n=1 Tax=Brevibacillus humidisoli TaxID=2895522 RepID=UPI001E28D33B|nr:hypothetical protein [Brevibacillus humidisoli]UFJ40120.1 hypothetical protein LOK74_19090 [Brevibacillus humidisoli]
MELYRVHVDMPRRWLSSYGWMILGAAEFVSSLMVGMLLILFGLFLIGIPLLLFGVWGAIGTWKKARKCSRFACQRCGKRLVVYRYHYEVRCPRCRADHDIEWPDEGHL